MNVVTQLIEPRLSWQFWITMPILTVVQSYIVKIMPTSITGVTENRPVTPSYASKRLQIHS